MNHWFARLFELDYRLTCNNGIGGECLQTYAFCTPSRLAPASQHIKWGVRALEAHMLSLLIAWRSSALTPREPWYCVYTLVTWKSNVFFACAVGWTWLGVDKRKARTVQVGSIWLHAWSCNNASSSYSPVHRSELRSKDRQGLLWSRHYWTQILQRNMGRTNWGPLWLPETV